MKEKEPEGLTPEAQKEYERFHKAYQRLLTQAKKKSFSVLVWGPSPGRKTPIGEKRRQIRDELIRIGHNAMFSENISTPDEAGASEKTKEFAQAHAAHLIIVLVEDAPGALAEVHDFCEMPGLTEKMYVLVPQKYKEGYSSQGALADLSEGYGGVVWYAEEELKSCQVLTQAIRRVEARRHIQVRRRKR